MLGEIGPSIWALARSWLTPAALFLLLNLVIGTIALSSKTSRSRHGHDPQPKPALHRLRSIGLHRYPSTDVPLDLSTPPHVPSSHEEFVTPRDVPQLRLSRAPSVLERLLSVGLYRYPSTDVPLDPSTAPHVPSRHEEFNDPARAPGLSRAPSLLELLHSIGLYRYRSGELPLEPTPPPAAEPEAVEGHAGSHQCGRSQSEPRARAGVEGKRAARVKKSASAKAANEEEACEVDARADDFINRFRQQLRLQRLDSVKNYEDMLDRGK